MQRLIKSHYTVFTWLSNQDEGMCPNPNSMHMQILVGNFLQIIGWPHLLQRNASEFLLSDTIESMEVFFTFIYTTGTAP